MLKRIYLIYAFVLLNLLCFSQENYQFIGANEFFEKTYTLEDNLIIDVQPAKDFKKTHIQKSVNLYNIESLKNYTDTINTNRCILIYCLTDVRSKSATKILAEKGFLCVYVLKGGLESWIENGFPVVEK